MNKKQTSNTKATLASNTLRNSGASSLQKSLAGSALAQSGTNKQTSKTIETKASAALRSAASSPVTKSLAGTVVSQSKKKP